jgi:hypothetical protein
VNGTSTGAGPRRRLIAWGLAISLVYLGVVAVSISLGWIASRPLYDGMVPLPPYRWINPPAEREQDNQAPQAETFQVRMTPEGLTDPVSVTTSDGQATVTFYLITPVKGESFVVTVTPQDPAQVAGAPEGSYFDGNAYKVEGAYEGSLAPLEGSFSIVLRYSVHARRMLALKDSAWEALFQPLVTPIDLQMIARTPVLGTFVASGEGVRPATGAPHDEAPSSQATVEPYRWVKPPPGRAGDNQKPGTESFTIRVDSFGQTDPESVATSDGQVAAGFVHVPPGEEKSSVEVVIEPLDPYELGPPPQGQHFDGNAYRITAAYAGSDDPIPNAPSSVIFRHQDDAQQIMVLGDSGWVSLPNPSYGRRSQVISVRTTASGTYVVAARGAPEAAGPENSRLVGWWIGVGLMVVLVAVAVPMRRRRAKVTEVETKSELL